MRLLYLVLIAFLLPVPGAVAQSIIRGTIKGADGAYVPYATIILQQLPDSTILTTGVADSNGAYQVVAHTAKKALLSASGTGYAAATRILELKNGTQTADLILAASMELKEVAVSSKKALIERRTDRIIFNVENSIASTGGDAMDALGKAPGVHVSSTEDISLAGKGAVNVMLNDRLQQLSGEELAELLHAIPAESISKIEIITNPPAKYDAAGVSGLINIVTRKQNKQGLNGTLGLSYTRNHFSSTRPSASFNYRKDKINIYGHTDFGDNFSKPTEQHTSFYTGQTLKQTDNTDNLHNFHYSQLGADYNITPKAVIGILYTYAGSTPKRNEDITGMLINNGGGIDSIINTKAHTYDFGERNVVNVNYEWKIDSAGKKLNMGGDFFTRTGRTVRDFTTINMLDDGSPTGTGSTDRSTGRQVLYIGSAKADMELPTKFAKLSFGGKTSFIHVISDNIFAYLAGSDYINDPGKSNKFDYKENTQALYLSGQKKLNEHWEAQAGLRGEYTQTEAISVTISQAHNTDYMKLFPSAYLQYSINEDNVFNLTYGRRIERPNMGMINPFRIYLTPTTWSEGNPFLQPSFTSTAELSYTLRSKYSFSVYTQHTQQLATQVQQIDTATRGFNFQYANIGTSLNTGITASATMNPAKWWECNVQFYGFHAHVNANYYNTTTRNEYDVNSFTLEGDNTFTLNKAKTWMAECGFAYNTAAIDNYVYHYPNYTINAGMRFFLLKRNLIIGFTVGDIFRTEIIKTKNQYNNALSNNYYDERAIQVNATWKLGNKNIRSKREHTGGAGDEAKRM